MKQVNSWTHWQPLKQVVLANVYPPEFFEDIKDTKLRDSLQKVVHETKEDLDGIKKTLKDLGVEVIQVDDCWADSLGLNPYKTFGEFLEKSKEYKTPLGLPKPLMAPRDSYITMGDDLLITTQYNPQMPIDGKHPLDMFNTNMSLVNDMWKNIDSKLGPFKVKSDNEMFPFQEHFDMNMKYDEINFKIYLWETWNFGAPHITRIGDTILIDEKEKTGFAEWYNKISNNKFKVKIVDVGGHNDGCMNLPKPGLVVAAPWMKKEFFKDSLPGWDCLIIEHPNNFEQLYPKEYYKFRDTKKQNMAWYVDGKMDYKPLTDFVDTYLKNWVGFMEESVFEVNMLSIDEKTVLSFNKQKEVHDKLRQHGIEPIYCKFRHRHFWDAGLHCLTLDTVREGGCETYL